MKGQGNCILLGQNVVTLTESNATQGKSPRTVQTMVCGGTF